MDEIANDPPPPTIDEASRRIAKCHRTRAQELHNGGLHLREIPEAVAELTWLKRLICGLDANQQTALPPELTGLTALTGLRTGTQRNADH